MGSEAPHDPKNISEAIPLLQCLNTHKANIDILGGIHKSLLNTKTDSKPIWNNPRLKLVFHSYAITLDLVLLHIASGFFSLAHGLKAGC